MRAALNLIGILFLAFFVTAPSVARAELATETEMRQVCENWLAYMVRERGTWAGDVSPEIVDTIELRHEDLLVGRVYSIDPRGFVVVPILKELAPIKGYSEECDFHPDQQDGIPRLLREVLHRRLLAQIDARGRLETPGRAPGSSGPSPGEQWNRFACSREQFETDTKGSLPRLVGVGPLLTSDWTQTGPYNLFCPIGYYGNHCGVGCVALAQAQVMRYHEWPPSGVGAFGYQWNGDASCGDEIVGGGYLSAGFSDPYDWDNMLDEYDFSSTQIQKEAVAELCYEAGISVHTYYGVCGSGSQYEYSKGALETYFQYEPGIQRVFQSHYTSESWFQIIKAEIDNARPILYCIPHHAMVCDGWREAAGILEFHMNYGAGPSMNLWYTLDELPFSSGVGDELMRWIMPVHRITVVRADGSGDYATIQEAIDAAPNGQVIRLEDGLYAGPGNRNLQVDGKSLSISSESGNPESCVIDCGHLSRGLTLNGDRTQSVVLKGITIVNGSASGSSPDDKGGAIYSAGPSLHMIGCAILDSHAVGDGGGIFCDSSDVQINTCRLAGNSSGGSGGGIFCSDSARPSILASMVYGNSAAIGGGGIRAENLRVLEDCAVYGNRAGGEGGGVYSCLDPDSKSWIIGCTFSGNSAGESGGGVYYAASCSLFVERSILWANAATVAGGDFYAEVSPAVRFGCCNVDSSGVEGTDFVNWAWYNTHVDPGFCDPRPATAAPTADGGYHLKDVSPCAPAQTVCGLVGALDVGCTPGIHVVRSDGSGDFETIQDAIDGIPWYDIIELSSGTYTGDGNRGLDPQGKPLILRSRSGAADSCVIDCEGAGRAFLFQSGEDGGTVIRDLTIMNGHAPSGGAILCDGASPKIEGCILHHNSADEFGGAICLADADPLIECCTLAENSAPTGGGLHCGSSSPHLSNTILALSLSGEALSCEGVSDPILLCCDLYNNAGGDWVGPIAGQDSAGGNFSADPLFYDIAVSDYHLHDSSPCLDALGCGRVGALGRKFSGTRVWHIPADAPSIGAGIDSAWAGDTVLVAPGTYEEHGLVMKPGICLVGAGTRADSVIIDAGGLGRVLSCIDVDSTAVIQGLTFTGGLAGGGWPLNAGGAVYCENASPRITRCVFRSNGAQYGGALACYSAHPTVAHCTFVGNSGTSDGGGIYSYYFSSVLVENSIVAFSAQGGAISCHYNGTVTLSCSDIYGNPGGDWVEDIADQDGMNGNLCADPLFCDWENGDCRIREDSPCAPDHSAPGCDLIGALEAGCSVTSVVNAGTRIPETLFLGPAVPNPFNPVTQITYGIPASPGRSHVVLTVYDCLGRRVTTLVDADRAPGMYTAAWDGRDHKGIEVASGVYFYRLAWDRKSMTGRMVLLK